MRIVHVSDFHLPSKTDKQVNGFYPYENLRTAVGEIKRESPRPDLIMLGGDCFEEGDKGDYRIVFELFEELQVPVHMVLGNHDHLPTFKKTSGLPAPADSPGYYSFDQAGHHLVVLNSASTGKPYGRLEEDQLLWLNADLHEHRFKPILIFLHHPPFDCGVPWLDKIRLLNAEGFWEVIPPFARNILGVFVSHLHMAVSSCHRQILLASTPATCWQYTGSADAAKVTLSSESPGFNVIDLAKSRLSIRTMRFPAASPEEVNASKSSTRDSGSGGSGASGASGGTRGSGEDDGLKGSVDSLSRP